MSYRYRLWGLNWFPLVGFALGSMSLWSYLKYYDMATMDDLQGLKWKLPVQLFGWTILWRSLVQGHFKVRFFFYFVWSCFILSEIGQSVYRHDGLRFALSLFLGGIFYFASDWLEKVLEKASVNPKLNWFVGKLNPIPHAEAEVRIGESAEYQVGIRAIDEYGIFILFKDSDAEVIQQSKVTPRTLMQVKLKYKSMEVSAEGKAMAYLDWDQRGFGVQFSFEDLYHQNKYTSLVRQIKGEGLA